MQGSPKLSVSAWSPKMEPFGALLALVDVAHPARPKWLLAGFVRVFGCCVCHFGCVFGLLAP